MKYRHYRKKHQSRSAFIIGGTLRFKDKLYQCLSVEGPRGGDRVVTWETDCQTCGVMFSFVTGASYAFAMRRYCDEDRPEVKSPRQSEWITGSGAESGKGPVTGSGKTHVRDNTAGPPTVVEGGQVWVPQETSGPARQEED